MTSAADAALIPRQAGGVDAKAPRGRPIRDSPTMGLRERDG